MEGMSKTNAHHCESIEIGSQLSFLSFFLENNFFRFSQKTDNLFIFL